MRSKDTLFSTRRNTRMGALLSDTSGNTLAMTAAVVIPLLAIAGGAIDAGRMYYAKNQLQFACDSAVLAGRKTMEGKTMDSKTEQTIDEFFHNNYKEGMLHTSDTDIEPSVVGDGLVSATATTSIPMTVMAVFGYGEKDLTVQCTAARNIGNTDIMFVLDTTLSMTQTNPEDSDKRIVALRKAVEDFYDVLPAVDNGSARVRYGFMPFSNNVNVGGDVKQWLAHDWSYQSRKFVKNNEVTSTSNYIDQWGSWKWVSGTKSDANSVIEDEACLPPTSTYTNKDTYAKIKEETQSNGDVWIYYELTRVENGTLNNATLSGYTCNVKAITYDNYTSKIPFIKKPHKSTSTTNYAVWNYDYLPYDVSMMRNGPGSQITARIGAGNTDKTFKWQGCIEERKTLPLTNNSDSSQALDLNINLVPDMTDTDNSDGTQWGPAIPELIYGRQKPGGAWHMPAIDIAENVFVPPWMGSYMGNLAVCPSAASRLKLWEDKQDVSDYVRGLVPGGSTYPDIGIIWGARYLSGSGIFRADNESAPNGDPISRNIILMTDGQVEANPLNATSYGFEMLDRRRIDGTPTVFPTSTTMDTVVDDRFARACANAKAQGMVVWVVAFGTELSDPLRQCSSNNRAYKANDAKELRAAFSDIATKIGKLRLTK